MPDFEQFSYCVNADGSVTITVRHRPEPTPARDTVQVDHNYLACRACKSPKLQYWGKTGYRCLNCRAEYEGKE